MKKKADIFLPKGKEAKNVEFKLVDGKIEVSYDIVDIFKDGDFLVSKRGNIFIYNGNEIECFLGCYVGFTKNGDIYISHKQINKWTLKDGCRYATEQEKQSFLERLEKMYKKKWNAEKKCLEDIYVPKFGDVVKVCIDTEYPAMRNYMICIFPNKEIPSISDTAFFDIANLGRTGNVCYVCGFFSKNDIVQASEFEKKELFDKLEKIGKRWNPETKRIEDIRFMPHDGEQYWFITDFSEVVYTRYNSNNNADYFRATSNNCFKTEDAAQKVADQIKEIFKNSKAE